MGTHPNVILMAVLTPHGLARKTMAAILAEAGTDMDGHVTVSGVEYSPIIMESDYNEDMQIAAKEGDLVFLDLVTYGYVEVIGWADLETRKQALEVWAKDTAARHQCDWRIDVSANYW
jgi:hypothetical protein